ncbi:MAG TPA: LytR C-terminal domain-containing protein [Telluria sp.]|nr:LytR C-terminal domain-containing protein [Telluria sp.]
MQATLKRIASACAGALLLACANTPGDRPQLAPEAVDGSAAAENRRATGLAEQADYAGAIAIWRRLTAAHTGPESAYLFRNLGYALFLNGEYDASLAALEKACLLDPLNARGWQHLGSALRKLGQPDRAELMFRQAAALERHEFTADYALAKGSSVPAIVSAVAAPPRTTRDWASRELDASSGVVDLRGMAAKAEPVEAPVQELAGAVPMVSAAADKLDADAAEPAGVSTAPVEMPITATAAPAAVGQAQPAPVRIEVRNGNGVRGMAAATARRISNERLRVVRLTNQKGFSVERTRIEYESGFRDAASKLAEKFGAATMVEVDNCWKTDMRLVIGKDQVANRTAAAARKTKRAVPGAKALEAREARARDSRTPAPG